MKKSLFISLFCFVLSFTCLMCGIGAGILKNNNEAEEPVTTVATQPTTESPTVTIDSKEPLTLEQGDAKVITLTQSDQELLTEWTSSDEKIVSVDDGGRVDALSIGTATITAHLSENKKIDCEITVTEAQEKSKDIFSTSIKANSDVLEDNINDGSGQNPYAIYVNRQMNCVTVYTYDDDGEYTVPVRAMVCSCGENNGTIKGEFGIYFKKEWQPLYENVYGHYTSGISGDYLFHSVPYYTPSPDDLEVEEFNKLGTSASLGCVRMATSDVKWIYDNCPHNTFIKIYDDENPGPLGKPETIRITNMSCGWDPTDDNKNNPYYDKRPEITGVEDCTISKGGTFSPLGGVKAYDTCSNDITDKISVTGNVVTSHTGKYKVTYSVTDVLNRTTSVDIYVTVE